MSLRLSATMISRMMLNLRDPRLTDNARSKDDSLPVVVTSFFPMEAPLSMIVSSPPSTRMTADDHILEELDTGGGISEIPRQRQY
ncbi:hypothetical protein SERLA73DRAFT_174789 [Serpula lacrymans var. lacrymans S7.3]|uniref:Uncharacterized protein n=2 Tax=Serpula lacrymans var. lacrymans TaxID=341189 RepID=F8PKK5_SERL3|nr:uncharacterized protein SERLADRAFT_456450 [Serpula lacrymans var. lacrymans S7.9]EGO03339.1 hypothetical protein SERLA73DRAFT_174789 [Serpula lacrymans var. lacrymans S7.3]EGO29112.1 hypothetical protein SERLADRAFT_456450 [Serpula lacrymans var. lacrymans S7.9]